MKNMKNIFLMNKSVLFALTPCLIVIAAVLEIIVMNVLKDSTGLKAGVNANNILNVLMKNTQNLFLMNKSVLFALILCLNVTYVT
jgi:hypothetical protein